MCNFSKSKPKFVVTSFIAQEIKRKSANAVELIQLQPTPAIPLTGGSSPAARTIKLTFRYPLTPAERSSGSQSRSHFLKKQCPTKKGWTLSSSSKTYITFYIWELSRLWTHCAHCRWLQHPTRKTSQELWFIWAIQMNTRVYVLSVSFQSFAWGRCTLNSPITASVLSERESHTCKEAQFNSSDATEVF